MKRLAVTALVVVISIFSMAGWAHAKWHLQPVLSESIQPSRNAGNSFNSAACDVYATEMCTEEHPDGRDPFQFLFTPAFRAAKIHDTWKSPWGSHQSDMATKYIIPHGAPIYDPVIWKGDSYQTTFMDESLAAKIGRAVGKEYSAETSFFTRGILSYKEGRICCGQDDWVACIVMDDKPVTTPPIPLPFKGTRFSYTRQTEGEPVGPVWGGSDVTPTPWMPMHGNDWRFGGLTNWDLHNRPVSDLGVSITITCPPWPGGSGGTSPPGPSWSGPSWDEIALTVSPRCE